MQFNLVSRWCFPESTGGVAMHNFYLSQVIKSSFDCRLLSFHSLKNINKYHDIGINYSGITPLVSLNINLSTIKNSVRSFSDYNISKQFSDKVNNESGIIEFMDIHSEGYYFLKNNPKKRKNVVIRAHTPFGLLKQYYTKDELNGVDTWFAYEREKKCFQWAKKITTPSIELKERICSLYKIQPEKITVIPNILDTIHFSPQKVVKNQVFTILHVGRFERAKGVETLIKSFIQLSCSYNITIGNHVDIADECLIIDNDFHGMGDNLQKQAPIIIEDDVWLATRVIVLKGVTIGKGSVIGAGSVVTKSIPPNSFAAGVPAKVIRPI